MDYNHSKRHIKQLTSDAVHELYKSAGKPKNTSHYFKQKNKNVIAADTSDWEAFRVLFKPNAAE